MHSTQKIKQQNIVQQRKENNINNNIIQAKSKANLLPNAK